MIAVLILNNGSFLDISMYDSAYTVEPGLIYVSSMDQDKCGLMDLFTGENLLDASYDYIHKTGERIFARKDDAWTVYEVNFVQ